MLMAGHAKKRICPLGRKRPQACPGCELSDCAVRAKIGPWCPTPEQIAAACDAIQANWAEAERERRRIPGSWSHGRLAIFWEVPEVHLDCDEPDTSDRWFYWT